jgi:2-isopropylmalate synthase
MPHTHTESVEPASASSARRIIVFDTTLRDGEQAAGVCFSLRDKLDIAGALDALGVDVIEAGFPRSAPAEFAAVQAVARRVENASVCALSDASPAHIDTTWEALRAARDPRLHVVLSISQVHLDHQLRRDREFVAELARESVAHARRYTANVEFSAMDATRADPEFLARVLRAAISAGASTVNLPDTVGCARPAQIAALFRELAKRVPELEGVVLSFHGQDDLGLATANTLAAIEAGAGQVELAVNGIGERAGNTSLEEVVMAIRVHGASLGVRTGVDTRGIFRLSRLVEERSGIAVPPNKAIVGGNAFRHASGLHQDGVLKRRETYEILDPAEIGNPTGSQIVLGKLSGRHGFKARAEQIGLRLEGVELERAFARFKASCHAGELSDDELRGICAAEEAWPGPGV